jgi:hypothetical protein
VSSSALGTSKQSWPVVPLICSADASNNIFLNLVYIMRGFGDQAWGKVVGVLRGSDKGAADRRVWQAKTAMLLLSCRVGLSLQSTKPASN